MASSSNAPTPNKNNTLMRFLRDLELSRKESFEQLRKDKEQSDLRIQEHIQRLEAREQEREARKEVILGITHYKRSKLQRFLSSKEKMTQTSTLSGNKKWTKLLPFM